MNTRLQVEHPVTEMVTGTDLVQWQINIARGERLTLDPDAMLRPYGHAIECRIYAEDPDRKFMPSPGRILGLFAPAGPGIRRDSGVEAGFEVPIFYDSMISKLVAWGETRDQAIARLRRALSEYEVRGIKTTIPFFQWILATDDFKAGRFDTTYLDQVLAERAGAPFVEAPAEAEELAVLATAIRSYFRARVPEGSRARTGAARPSSGWAQAARREALR
jgi:acetyl-CoA carboxylase biotin carboxylase subunit